MVASKTKSPFQLIAEVIAKQINVIKDNIHLIWGEPHTDKSMGWVYGNNDERPKGFSNAFPKGVIAGEG